MKTLSAYAKSSFGAIDAALFDGEFARAVSEVEPCEIVEMNLSGAVSAKPLFLRSRYSSWSQHPALGRIIGAMKDEEQSSKFLETLLSSEALVFNARGSDVVLQRPGAATSSTKLHRFARHQGSMFTTDDIDALRHDYAADKDGPTDYYRTSSTRAYTNGEPFPHKLMIEFLDDVPNRVIEPRTQSSDSGVHGYPEDSIEHDILEIRRIVALGYDDLVEIDAPYFRMKDGLVATMFFGELSGDDGAAFKLLPENEKFREIMIRRCGPEGNIPWTAFGPGLKPLWVASTASYIRSGVKRLTTNLASRGIIATDRYIIGVSSSGIPSAADNVPWVTSRFAQFGEETVEMSLPKTMPSKNYVLPRLGCSMTVLYGNAGDGIAIETLGVMEYDIYYISARQSTAHAYDYTLPQGSPLVSFGSKSPQNGGFYAEANHAAIVKFLLATRPSTLSSDPLSSGDVVIEASDVTYEKGGKATGETFLAASLARFTRVGRELLLQGSPPRYYLPILGYMGDCQPMFIISSAHVSSRIALAYADPIEEGVEVGPLWESSYDDTKPIGPFVSEDGGLFDPENPNDGSVNDEMSVPSVVVSSINVISHSCGFSLAPEWVVSAATNGFGLFKGLSGKQLSVFTELAAQIAPDRFAIVCSSGRHNYPTDAVKRLSIYRDYKKAREKACLSNDFMKQRFVGSYSWGDADRATREAGGYNQVYAIMGEADLVVIPTFSEITYTYVPGTTPAELMRKVGASEATKIGVSESELVYEHLFGGAKLVGITFPVLSSSWGVEVPDGVDKERSKMESEVTRVKQATEISNGGAYANWSTEALTAAGYPVLGAMTYQDALKTLITSATLYRRHGAMFFSALNRVPNGAAPSLITRGYKKIGKGALNDAYFL